MREQLEMLIDHACRVSDSHEVYVLGSQSALGTIQELPPDVPMSTEADLLPSDRSTETAWRINEELGEESAFYSKWGVYAEATDQVIGILPDGWESRLVDIDTKQGNVGHCLEIHDLCISKLNAGRSGKYDTTDDVDYVRKLINIGAVNPDVLRERLVATPEISPDKREGIEQRIILATSPEPLSASKAYELLRAREKRSTGH